MLQVRGLSRQHGQQFALSLEDWGVAAGQFQALLGCNGAGKSTLLRVIAGDLESRGTIEFHGRQLSEWSALERARNLAVLPQSSDLSFGFQVSEVVALGLTPLSVSWRETRLAVRRAMELTDCAHLARQSYPGLSGGEKQRVQLARVLLQLSQAEREPLLLLDEPTSAQDLGQQHRLLKFVSSLCREQRYAVVAVLHDLNHALRYADSALLMDAGRQVAKGCPRDVLTPERVARHWGYQASYLSDPRGNPVLV